MTLCPIRAATYVWKTPIALATTATPTIAPISSQSSRMSGPPATKRASSKIFRIRSGLRTPSPDESRIARRQ
jgi:hypothetical protein